MSRLGLLFRLLGLFLTLRGKSKDWLIVSLVFNERNNIPRTLSHGGVEVGIGNMLWRYPLQHAIFIILFHLPYFRIGD